MDSPLKAAPDSGQSSLGSATALQMTDAERAVLARGFRGPRPGSNSFSYLNVTDLGVQIDGERIDAMIRAGVLIGSPVSGPVEVIKGGPAGPYGGIPMRDFNFRKLIRSQRLVSEHIGWLKMHLRGAEPHNWRDMVLRAERQLDELEKLVLLPDTTRRDGEQPGAPVGGTK